MCACACVCIHSCLHAHVLNTLLPLHYEHSTGKHDDRQVAALSQPWWRLHIGPRGADILGFDAEDRVSG